MDGDHGVPVGVVHFVEHAIAQDPGRIDHRVQSAETVHGLNDHVAHRAHVGHTVGVGDGFAAGGLDLVDHGLRRTGRSLIAAGHRTAEVVDHHSRAGLRSRQRTGPTDTVTTASDQHDLAIKHAHGVFLSRVILF